MELEIVVYIPNGIYDLCKYKQESLEEFVKMVFKEWVEEYIYDDSGIHELIKSISVIESEFGT